MLAICLNVEASGSIPLSTPYLLGNMDGRQQEITNLNGIQSSGPVSGSRFYGGDDMLTNEDGLTIAQEIAAGTNALSGAIAATNGGGIGTSLTNPIVTNATYIGGNAPGVSNVPLSAISSNTPAYIVAFNANGKAVATNSFTASIAGVLTNSTTNAASVAATNFYGGTFYGNGAGLSNLTATATNAIANLNGSGTNTTLTSSNFTLNPSSGVYQIVASNIGGTVLANDSLFNSFYGLNAGPYPGSAPTGKQNAVLGQGSAANLTSGSNNAVIGALSLGIATTAHDNLIVGVQSGNSITTNTNNLYIGNGISGSSTEQNTIRIGTTQSNTFIAGRINGDGGGLTNVNFPLLTFTSVTSLPITNLVWTGESTAQGLGSCTLAGSQSPIALIKLTNCGYGQMIANALNLPINNMAQSGYPSYHNQFNEITPVNTGYQYPFSTLQSNNLINIGNTLNNDYTFAGTSNTNIIPTCASIEAASVVCASFNASDRHPLGTDLLSGGNPYGTTTGTWLQNGTGPSYWAPVIYHSGIYSATSGATATATNYGGTCVIGYDIFAGNPGLGANMGVYVNGVLQATITTQDLTFSYAPQIQSWSNACGVYCLSNLPSPCTVTCSNAGGLTGLGVEFILSPSLRTNPCTVLQQEGHYAPGLNAPTVPSSSIIAGNIYYSNAIAQLQGIGFSNVIWVPEYATMPTNLIGPDNIHFCNNGHKVFAQNTLNAYLKSFGYPNSVLTSGLFKGPVPYSTNLGTLTFNTGYACPNSVSYEDIYITITNNASSSAGTWCDVVNLTNNQANQFYGVAAEPPMVYSGRFNAAEFFTNTISFRAYGGWSWGIQNADTNLSGVLTNRIVVTQ